MVFLENFYEILLLVHLFATIVLVGSMTHNLLISEDRSQKTEVRRQITEDKL